jgi:hypothetical protein
MQACTPDIDRIVATVESRRPRAMLGLSGFLGLHPVESAEVFSRVSDQ